jgi:pimeloyl-ACP methyl ester carboxylesterase
MTTRILFLHGLEGSPQGHKATWLRSAGFEVTAPALATGAILPLLSVGMPPLPEATFAEALATARAALEQARPEVLVGSSFGGGLAVELVHRGVFNGPLVLLAPAATRLFGRTRLPGGHGRALVLHGRADDVVPVGDSVALASRSPGEVHLCLVDDDHRLAASVDAGVLGRLVRAAVG